MSVRVILWKEVVDLARDRRTLAAVVLFPLLGMPALALFAGVLASTQVVSVYVAYEEDEVAGFARSLGEAISEGLSSRGLTANITVGPPPAELSGVDVLVVIPRGFYGNVTSLGGVGYIHVRSIIGSVAADTARGVVGEIVSRVSLEIAKARIGELAGMAGVDVDPDAVLSPIRVRTDYYRPGGAPASQKEAEVAETARLIEFGLFFVVNPAVVYMADSVLGEKERRTIESLLMTPVSRRRLLAGKIAASSLVGFIAAMADTVGLLAYIKLLSSFGLSVTPGLVAVHAMTTMLLVVMVASMVAPVVARSQSVRAGQTVSLLLISVAGVVYFASLLVDLARVPPLVSAVLYAIPFTHAAMIIHRFILGEGMLALLHAGAMALFIAAFLLLAVRVFDSERLILYRE